MSDDKNIFFLLKKIISIFFKVILLSPAMYNVKQTDPDVRWHQEPMVDIIFVSYLIY
jgi:hypothetical protein